MSPTRTILAVLTCVLLTSCACKNSSEKVARLEHHDAAVPTCGSGKTIETAELFCESGRTSDLTGLARLTQLQRLKVEVQTTNLTPLCNLPRLKALTLYGARFSSLATLECAPVLDYLYLSKPKGRRIPLLAGTPKLRTLVIDESTVTDIRGLMRLDLRLLVIMKTPLSDIAALAQLTALTRLEILDSPVSNLSPLERLSNLVELRLAGTRVADLSPLAAVTRLRRLDLASTRAQDLTPIAGLPHLEQLSLSKTLVSNLRPLAKLRHLRELDLDATRVRNVEALAQLKMLEKLDLRGTKVESLKPLSSLARLRVLTVDENWRTAEIRALRKKLPKLVVGH